VGEGNERGLAVSGRGEARGCDVGLVGPGAKAERSVTRAVTGGGRKGRVGPVCKWERGEGK
jgi:hypothetical protein